MNLSEIDLSEINLETIGQWPLKSRIIVVSVCVFLFLIVGYYFISTNKNRELMDQKEREKKLKETYLVENKKASSLGVYHKQNKILKKNIADNLNLLGKQNPLSNLLAELSKQAVEQKLTYRMIRPLEIVEQPFYMEQPIALSLVGDYHRFGYFIEKISQLSQLVTVSNFDIRKREGANKDGLILDMVVKTYWQKPVVSQNEEIEK